MQHVRPWVVTVGVRDANNVSIDKAVTIAIVGRLDAHCRQRRTRGGVVPCSTSRQ